MSGNIEKPPGGGGGGYQPPIDDSGINNDHILDLCDFIINRAWEKYVGREERPTADELTIRDLRDLAYTMGAVWGLAQDIISLDTQLRDMGGEMDGPDGPMFGPYEDDDQ